MATTNSQFSDMGKTDVLLIVSEPDSRNPLVVPRRPNTELSPPEVVKLENQGVAKEHHTDDLSIMKARYELDKDCCMVGVEQGQTDRELSSVDVRKKISSVFSTTKNQSGIFVQSVLLSIRL